ncbi:TetR/AcrR family transcriptional regulator [Glycomyces buryatensis]|uniref:TetR/AcrR family transcriptional regulator n=1 Tax=Glycomyces buryatensis TaxID=2570927 RepID=A0A4S8QC66_9ACTN|nr:TetR/AcrR family transcriptional regulator [Glycomyces buryatensis]THV41948.1 TetR/AcrR family transcriptional regulator [Glycomyces buryatensis]
MQPELSDTGRPAVPAVPADPAVPESGFAARATHTKGRPRSQAVSRSIIDAALDLIAERGTIKDVSMEAVAERSGVSKATIYRRWSSKEELVAEAVESMKAPIDYDLPHTSVRDDLLIIARRMRKQFSPRENAVMTCLALELRTNPELRKFHDEFHGRRRELVKNVLRLGIERGELRDDLDLDLTTVMIVAPIVSVQVYGHHSELRGPDLAERVVDNLFQGLRPRD